MEPTFTMPAGVAFDDLHLACVGDELQCDWGAFTRMLRASGYTDNALEHPELIVTLLLRWYDAHCREGGAPSLPMEQMLARASGAGSDSVAVLAPGVHRH